MFGKNSLKGEKVGDTIRVINSANKSEIGLSGKIIDETKNMLIIKTRKGIKKIIKNNVTIKRI